MSGLTAERLREVLSYDPETGIFTWIKRPAAVCKVIVGNQAGSFKEGYRHIRIDGIAYCEHRLAFLWMLGKWPPEEVDHINSKPSDNRWENLRLATVAENRRNVSLHRDNRSGFKGVRKGCGKNKWQAFITLGGRFVHLGMFDSPEVAHAAYYNAAIKHFGNFARSK